MPYILKANSTQAYLNKYEKGIAHWVEDRASAKIFKRVNSIPKKLDNDKMTIIYVRGVN